MDFNYIPIHKTNNEWCDMILSQLWIWNNWCFLFAHRYLKSVFPTVEEYLLLDVLTNNDNNVQKAADKLVKMGYVKRDTPSK